MSDRPQTRSELRRQSDEMLYTMYADVRMDATTNEARSAFGGLVQTVEATPDDGVYEVVVSIRAPTDAEAYRRVTNYIQATLEGAALHQTGAVVSVEAYNGGETVQFD